MNDEIIIQIYRGGIPGATPQIRRDKLAIALRDLKAAGFKNAAFHGFPRELVENWDGLAKLASDNGLGALAAWGLDGETDNDGSPLTGKEKGECMGTVLAKPTCLAGLADGEGRYDTSTGPNDVTDEDDVLAMGEALRKIAPNAIVGDQCWFAIDSHGSLRTTPLVADPQNVFRGFPVDEFARKVVNWFQFRQAYFSEAGFKARWGRERAVKVIAWMERDWLSIKAAFEKANLFYNPGITLQAYGHDDIPAALMHVLMTYNGERAQPVIGWAEYYPSRLFIICAQAMLFLKARGYCLPGVPAIEEGKRYQRDFNKTAPVNGRLDEDGALGLKSLKSMGFML